MFGKRTLGILSSTLIFTFSAILWLVAQPAYGAVVYTNNFEGAVGSEWSNQTTASTPGGGRKFLGQFGNEHVTLSLAGLPAHGQINLSLDIFVIGSWYGNDPTNGPNIWTISIPGFGSGSFTFSNTSASQSYPDMYPGGDNPALTGASENNSLEYPGGDSVYHLSLNIPHFASSVSLDFSGSGLISSSWGLDNVSVDVGPGIDWEHPWPAGTPFPKFIQNHYIDLKYVESISKFRSGAGHDFSDDYETNRSMKHYYGLLPQYREANGTNHDVKIYAPVSGTVANIEQEFHQLSNGEYAGYQLHIIPDGYPAFLVRIFHVNYLSGLTTGTHVTAGQWLGYADMREAHDSDLAVECIYAAPRIYPGGLYPDRGEKFLSAFDVMTDALFGQYQARGIAQRSDAIITKEYRDAHPVTNWGTYDPFDWVQLQPQQLPRVNSGLLLLLN